MSFEVAAPAAAMIGFTFFARLQQGSWFAPGAFNALYFSFIVGMTVSLEVYKLWPWALWWIFFGVVLFYLGNLAGEGYAATDEKKARPLEELRHRWLHVAIPVGAALGVGHVFLNHWYFSFAPTFDDLYRPPLRYNILITFIHVTPMMGGIYAGLKNSKFRVALGLLSLLPLLFGSVVFSSRSGLIMAGSEFCAGYFAMRVLVERGRIRLFTWRKMSLAVCVGVAVYWLAFFVTLFRIGYQYDLGFGNIFDEYRRAWDAPVEKREEIWEGFRHAYTGGVAAFSVWLEWRWYQPPEPAWGYHLMSGVYELLGYQTRGGLDVVEVEPGVFSNVLTRYGQQALAFGLYGSQVWLFTMGIVFGWAYRRLKEGSILAIPFMVIFYADVTNGGIALNYNSTIASYAIVGTYAFLWSRSVSPVAFHAGAAKPPVDAPPAWAAAPFDRK